MMVPMCCEKCSYEVRARLQDMNGKHIDLFFKTYCGVVVWSHSFHPFFIRKGLAEGFAFHGRKCVLN
jgi:hypothetical protein